MHMYVLAVVLQREHDGVLGRLEAVFVHSHDDVTEQDATRQRVPMVHDRLPVRSIPECEKGILESDYCSACSIHQTEKMGLSGNIVVYRIPACSVLIGQ